MSLDSAELDEDAGGDGNGAVDALSVDGNLGRASDGSAERGDPVDLQVLDDLDDLAAKVILAIDRHFKTNILSLVPLGGAATNLIRL